MVVAYSLASADFASKMAPGAADTKLSGLSSCQAFNDGITTISRGNIRKACLITRVQRSLAYSSRGTVSLQRLTNASLPEVGHVSLSGHVRFQSLSVLQPRGCETSRKFECSRLQVRSFCATRFNFEMLGWAAAVLAWLVWNSSLFGLLLQRIIMWW